VRMRKYDFSGKLLDKVVVTNNGWEVYWAENTNVKNNRILTNTVEGTQKKIGYYDLKGNRIWSVDYSLPVSFTNLQFTRQNKIFFSGLSNLDTNKVGGTVVHVGRFWGFMDTTGTVLNIKTLSNLNIAARHPYLAPDGKLYLCASITTYSNPNSNSYTLDTITFNNLDYYDSTTGYGWGYSYQLLAQYKMDDSGYFNPGPSPFSLAEDSCLNEEGLSRCTVVTAINDIDQTQSVLVYPVPAKNFLNLDFTGNQLAFGKAQLIDVNGNIKKEIAVLKQYNRINISGFMPGTYVLSIQLRNGKTEKRKIIVLDH
jgi:hypothetical protein